VCSLLLECIERQYQTVAQNWTLQLNTKPGAAACFTAVSTWVWGARNLRA
jgi:hypothetical protein